MEASNISLAFDVLAEETKDLYVPSTIARITCPTPLEFLRDYVMKNRPVIITGAAEHWQAFSKWTDEYIKEALKDQAVTVALTPNGRADAPTEVNGKSFFVLPHETAMTIDEFFAHINKPPEKRHCVMYIQKQNGSFMDEYMILRGDVDDHVEWATEALGRMPDAVNMWIGTDDSVSSVHKDQYENLYFVVSGEKHFTLLPPTDRPFLYIHQYPLARYRQSSDNPLAFEVVPDEGSFVPWVSVDPDNPDYTRFPLYAKASPLRCVVRPGECLYLPALWYHQVSQKVDETGRVLAINYWYDMDYDLRYCYFRFLETLAQSAGDEEASEEAA